MNRKQTHRRMGLVFAGLGLLGAALAIGLPAYATPEPTGVIFNTRVFNDCSESILTTGGTYPDQIFIEDAASGCSGFANLHLWRFTEDGLNEAVFNNIDSFQFSATLTLSGTGEGESGLQISPWWSDADGRFNVRTTDGEIACFGGRLPFYSFTGTYGLHYVKGTPIWLEMTYLPNGLDELEPGTIEYKLRYNDTDYTSGQIPFDEGNPGEPYGTWGILDQAGVGAHVQVLFQASPPEAQFRAEWTDIVFTPLTPSPVEATSWGRIKHQFQ